MDQKKILNELAQAFTLNNAISLALDCLITQQIQQAIDLVAPFYQEGQDNNIQIIEILAIAHAYVPTEDSKNFTLWYTLFRYGEQYTKSDQTISTATIGLMKVHPIKFVINTLVNMITYTNSSARAIVFLQQIKSYSSKYPKLYKPSELKEFFYNAYFNTAVKSKTEAEKTSDFTSRQASFKKAITCIEQALTYKENDLKCLLFWARISMSATQNTIDAIDILLPYHDQYIKNPNYLYALARLYHLGKNEELAEKYNKEYKLYCKPGKNDQFTMLFQKINQDYCAETKFSTENAMHLFNSDKFHEAKEIVDQLIQQNPQDYLSLEISAETEVALGNNAQALATCEKILTINPKSPIALKIKAVSMWNRDSDEHKKEAIAFSEHAYEVLDCRKRRLFGILLMGHLKYANTEKFLLYSSAFIKIEPSAWLYSYMGNACIKLNKYPEAIDAFEAARKQCNTYQPNDIASALIYCHVMLATTMKDLLNCAHKIRCYLKNLESETPDLVIIDLIKIFKEMGITIISPQKTQKEKLATESKTDELPIIHSEQECLVPPEIKEKIIAAMNNSSFTEELPLDMDEYALSKPFQLKVKPEELVPIGESGHLFGYISPRLRKKLSKVEWRQFTTALKTHRLLDENSKNISGTKISKKYPNIYKLKIMADPRLFGKGHFFKELIIHQVKKIDLTVIELETVMRNHRQKNFNV